MMGFVFVGGITAKATAAAFILLWKKDMF